MSYVSITELSFPAGAEAEIEQRFAARKKAVDTAPGFESFELLRPAKDADTYLVITRWRSAEDLHAWLDATAEAHAAKAQAAKESGSGMAVTPREYEPVEL
ncbi:antibiotic biosynthesis monooxygenase family protein [Corynebacterium uberis]|uniref:antibiotic biosynthesis monooxygenase family protein n=1 Tax=Corynebacterium TaxID=1716 RepID=UPI001D09EA02|nr:MULTISPECIES: antibiotic biosynthesis monooxygenase [Corynebacterium]MCZ9308910.1 antibiotic biosynthesis monooxygenase [Corynebacterium sp. c6VSa_13]UDL74616.1 antibiotic biosynthesis monooxygenase [Corynebacterium uberis]UDL76550.1 antibiotic biosynthesis monooxygenase [Corynebacterium uberis]UDL78763.1 antibiotic biosynthesis monooxygenase [Corynebacterium uberis]UDL81041.1 antibiotic biosynthesis monooxygenase [Corynebacterium uberis]